MSGRMEGLGGQDDGVCVCEGNRKSGEKPIESKSKRNDCKNALNQFRHR